MGIFISDRHMRHTGADTGFRTTVMSDRFTKVKISLVLRVVHICLIHPLEAQICVYLIMYGRS